MGHSAAADSAEAKMPSGQNTTGIKFRQDKMRQGHNAAKYCKRKYTEKSNYLKITEINIFAVSKAKIFFSRFHSVYLIKLTITFILL